MRTLSPALLFAGCAAAPAPPVANTAHDPAPLLVATSSSRGESFAELTIARIDTAGVHPIAQLTDVDQFGWLDSHTLIVRASHMADDPTRIYRVIDGVIVQTITVPERGDLELTHGGQVYLGRCRQKVIYEGPCECSYVQVYPEHRAAEHVAPRDLDLGRTAKLSYLAEPWPRPATVAAPPGITLAQAKAVTCRRGGEETVFPDEEIATHFEPNVVENISARWVQAAPPIYEVYVDFEGPSYDDACPGDAKRHTFYFRGCADGLLGYVRLTAEIWGALEGETWTFWNGTTRLGGFPGEAAIRSNRWVTAR